MGGFRLLLAVFVVVGHLSGGWGDRAGIVAVFCFYVISGYLITRALCGPYGGGWKNLGAFAVNRILRLYPSYWVVALWGLAIAVWLPDVAVPLNPALTLPRDVPEILANLTIFGITPLGMEPYMMPVRLVPPAWSLSIELGYYLVLALLVARWPRRVAVWWFVSLLAAVWLFATDRIGHAYYTLWGPSLCFATGSLLHHLNAAAWGRRFGDGARVLVFVLLLVLCFSWNVFRFDYKFLNLYLAIPMAALAIALLTGGWRAAWLQKADRFFADMSYPVFLCHWHTAVLVSAWLLDGQRHSPSLFLVSLPVILLVAAMLAVVVERPVQWLRNRVRPTPARPPSTGFAGGRWWGLLTG